jgi:DNA primase
VIEAAREQVSVVELAEHLGTELRPSGKELRGRCPIHGGENPTSFAVDAEAGLWHCHSCGRGGDVVELARYAWRYERYEAAMAGADLLFTFNHSIPSRPSSWFAKQQRQQRVRNGIEAAKLHVARRRLYRRFFEPLILATVDEEDRAHDAQLFWEATEPLAEHLVGNMMRSGR